MGNDVRARVVAVPVCRPVRPRKGASIVRRVGRGVEIQCLHMDVHHSRMEMQRLWMAIPHLWMEMYCFGMETPLRGRSGGHTGTAPTISTYIAILQR